MKIVAWNVNHRTSAKDIPSELPNALLSLGPDVIVLTEYVPGTDHEGLCGKLGNLGFPHIHMSLLSPGHNQVLIATKEESVRGSISLGEPTPNARCNFLHVHLESGVDVVGFRVPAYKDSALKQKYWKRFAKKIRPLIREHAVLTGDFNTHLSRKNCVGAKELRGLVEEGWRLLTPERGASYCGPNGLSSIDHALIGQQLRARDAQYIAETNGFTFGGSATGGMSDHAVLAFDVVAK